MDQSEVDDAVLVRRHPNDLLVIAAQRDRVVLLHALVGRRRAVFGQIDGRAHVGKAPGAFGARALTHRRTVRQGVIVFLLTRQLRCDPPGRSLKSGSSRRKPRSPRRRAGIWPPQLTRPPSTTASCSTPVQRAGILARWSGWTARGAYPVLGGGNDDGGVVEQGTILRRPPAHSQAAARIAPATTPGPNGTGMRRPR